MSPASTASRLSGVGGGSKSASSMAGKISFTAAAASSLEAPASKSRAMRTQISGSATGLVKPANDTVLPDSSSARCIR